MSMIYRTAGSSSGSGGGSSGSQVFISKQTVTGTPSSIEFTSGIDSTYQTYMFLLEGITNNSTDYGGRLKINMSSDGGGSYGLNVYSATSSNFQTASSSGISYLTDYDNTNNTDGVSVTGTGVAGDTGFNASGTIHLHNPSSSTLTKFIIGRVAYKSNSGVGDFLSTARFDYSNDIDAVKFDLSSGSFTAGSISLYGFKTS